MIGRNDKNQSNNQFNFNPKRCGPNGSNPQCSQETPNHEKLRIQSALISRVISRKISPKNRRESRQEITVTEIEQAIKSFENNRSPGNDDLPEFYKTFNEILKTDLHKLCIEISQLGEMPRSMQGGSYILFGQKRRQRGHN